MLKLSNAASAAAVAVCLTMVPATPVSAQPPTSDSTPTPAATPTSRTTTTSTTTSTVPTGVPTGTATTSPTVRPTPTGSTSTTTARPTKAPTSDPARPAPRPAPRPPTATVDPAPPPPAGPPRTDEQPLSPAEVRAQLAQAAALAAQRRATDAGLQAAMERLQAIGRQTAVALDRLAAARQAEARARVQLQRSTQQLASLRGDLGLQRAELGQWARDTYSMGGAMAAYEGWLVALEGDSTADVARNLAALEHLGVTGGANLQRLESSVTAQAQITRQAALAAAQTKAASARTAAAVAELRLLQRQATVAAAQLRVQQARLIGTDRLSAQQRANLAAAQAIVAAAGADRSDCVGLDTAGFPNGAIPAAALCPVWGARGHLLRADAAAALSQLSRDYAAQFGRPLCLTDSYRTLAVQVRLKASKPALAARPGTSNHGWGAAVDLCDGVQSFGTPQHAWMLAHAPLRGWFHPAWAGPAGSKPEPWHWEFAG